MIEVLVDVEFGLSGSEISEGEGEDAYYYRGEACLTKESVEDFGRKLVSSSSGFSLDKSEGNSERVTGDTLKRFINKIVLFRSINIQNYNTS